MAILYFLLSALGYMESDTRLTGCMGKEKKQGVGTNTTQISNGILT